MAVPFIDFVRMHADIKSMMFKEIGEFIESDEFLRPPPESEYVTRFEKSFAAYCGTRFAIGVGSGTSALTLSLIASGIGRGDEVILPPNTFIATALSITACGATPVFADIDPGTYNMDPGKVREKMMDKTKAIIPVHLYGQPCDMHEIMEIASEKDLRVIEDACHAHGAEYGGSKCGSIGDVACFSFFPTKNLGCFGDGGAITSSNEEIIERVRAMKEYSGPETGPNLRMNPCGHSRLDPFQAMVLQAKMKYLDRWNGMRRSNAALYGKLLSGTGVVTPAEAAGRKHVFYLYVIRSGMRDGLMSRLEKQGIQTKVHYPVPIHMEKCFRDLGLPAGSFPAAEEAGRSILSLPMFPQLTAQEIEQVSEAVRDFCGGKGKD